MASCARLKRLREPGEDREVGVTADALDASDTERGEAVVVLQASELALDGGPAHAAWTRLESCEPEANSRVEKQWISWAEFVVGAEGFGPSTSQSRTGCSRRLSYAPACRADRFPGRFGIAEYRSGFLIRSVTVVAWRGSRSGGLTIRYRSRGYLNAPEMAWILQKACKWAVPLPISSTGSGAVGLLSTGGGNEL